MITKVFIFGGGPSLELLHLVQYQQAKNRGMKAISIATFRATVVFDKVLWRPDLFVKTEMRRYPTAVEDMTTYFKEGVQCWLTENVLHTISAPELGPSKAVPWWDWPQSFKPIVHCNHNSLPLYRWLEPKNWHLPHICTFGTSTNAAIQIATRYKPDLIVLVGCDGHYKPGSENHAFDYSFYNMSLVEAQELNNWMELATKLASKECRKLNIELVSGTPTHLPIKWFDYEEFLT
jgi:hypothetical protein